MEEVGKYVERFLFKEVEHRITLFSNLKESRLRRVLFWMVQKSVIKIGNAANSILIMLFSGRLN